MDYEDFESAGLTWEELQAIHDNYRGWNGSSVESVKILWMNTFMI